MDKPSFHGKSVELWRRITTMNPQTEVIHGIRYDGFASKFYEEKDDEERLSKSVEAFVQMTEAISTTAHFEQ